MQISRREFNRLAVAQAAWALVPAANVRAQSKGLPILQAFTDDSVSTLVVVQSKKQVLNFVVEELSGNAIVPAVQATQHDPFGFDHLIVHLQIQGLRLGERYRLRVLENNQILDEREFSALDLNKTTANVAYLSCANQHFHNPKMWQRVAVDQPDLILFIGDNVYADRTAAMDPLSYMREITPEYLWDNYIDAFHTNDYFKLRKLIPTVALWDDHDYGFNDADRTFQPKLESKKMLETFWALNAAGASLIRGPGVASGFRAFGQNFLQLDGRYFRSEPGAQMETHFGSEQEEWLLDHLSQSRELNWLATGSQWWGGYRTTDSVEGGQPRAFEKFLSQIKSTEKKCLFLSGDSHFSEVMKIEPRFLGFPTYEFVSSSIHSRTIPGWDWWNSNPRRICSTSAHNYLLFSLNGSNHMSVRAQLGFGESSGFNFSFSV